MELPAAFPLIFLARACRLRCRVCANNRQQPPRDRPRSSRRRDHDAEGSHQRPGPDGGHWTSGQARARVRQRRRNCPVVRVC